MKKILFFILVGIIFLFGCHNAELEKLKLQNDSLMSITSTDAVQINDYLKSFNEIQQNLNTIKEKEEIVAVNSKDGELDANAKDKINEDILAIYQLMLENKETIATLKKKVSSAAYKNTELQKTIDLFSAQITAKDAEITELKNSLAALNIDVANLNSKIENLNSNIDTLKQVSENQTEVISDQDAKLNTAYYVYGTKDELKSHNIISKDGILKGLKLDENFDSQYFTKIDIRTSTKINLNVKKATIMSIHPESSYKLIEADKKIQGIEITDYEKFWGKSKFLVILVD